MTRKRGPKECIINLKNVFVADHLTPEHARLLRKFKYVRGVTKVYSIVGKPRIHVKCENGEESEGQGYYRFLR